jgi:hypothetical protein
VYYGFVIPKNKCVKKRDTSSLTTRFGRWTLVYLDFFLHSLNLSLAKIGHCYYISSSTLIGDKARTDQAVIFIPFLSFFPFVPLGHRTLAVLLLLSIVKKSVSTHFLFVGGDSFWPL